MLGTFQKTLLACAVSAFCWVGSSHAAPLTPGMAVLATPAPGPLGGTLLATVTAPFSTANYSGTLTSQVILGDPANPLGPNFLTFTYSLEDNQTSTDSLERLTVSSFGIPGLLADVSFQLPTVPPTPPGAIFPTSFDRSTGLGDVIGTDFTPAPLGQGALLPGATGALIVVNTNATVYQGTLASVIDSLTANPASFAPLSVPEPTTLALMGLLGLVGLRRR